MSSYGLPYALNLASTDMGAVGVLTNTGGILNWNGVAVGSGGGGGGGTTVSSLLMTPLTTANVPQLPTNDVSVPGGAGSGMIFNTQGSGTYTIPANSIISGVASFGIQSGTTMVEGTASGAYLTFLLQYIESFATVPPITTTQAFSTVVPYVPKFDTTANFPSVVSVPFCVITSPDALVRDFQLSLENGCDTGIDSIIIGGASCAFTSWPVTGDVTTVDTNSALWAPFEP